MRDHAPGVSIQPHDDSLHASPVLGTSTLRKQLIYLFFSGIKTKVSNLKSFECTRFCQNEGKKRCQFGWSFLSTVLSVHQLIPYLHTKSLTSTRVHSASTYLLVPGSPCSSMVGLDSGRRLPSSVFFKVVWAVWERVEVESKIWTASSHIRIRLSHNNK